MTPFKLDTGRVPRMKYNRVVARGRRAEHRFSSPAITQRQALGIWKVAQDINGGYEPTLAIKKRADRDRTRRGFI